MSMPEKQIAELFSQVEQGQLPDLTVNPITFFQLASHNPNEGSPYYRMNLVDMCSLMLKKDPLKAHELNLFLENLYYRVINPQYGQHGYKDHNQKTLLHWEAAMGLVGDVSGVRQADLNVQDKKGRTPLMLACQNGHATSVGVLLNAGADFELETKKGNGHTALYFAQKHKHEDIIRMLQPKQGAETTTVASTPKQPKPAPAGPVSTTPVKPPPKRKFSSHGFFEAAGARNPPPKKGPSGNLYRVCGVKKSHAPKTVPPAPTEGARLAHQPTLLSTEATKYLAYIEKVAATFKNSFLPRGKKKYAKLQTVITTMRDKLVENHNLTKAQLLEGGVKQSLEDALKYRRYFPCSAGLTKGYGQVMRETDPAQLKAAVNAFIDAQCRRLKYRSNSTDKIEALKYFKENANFTSIEALCRSENGKHENFLEVLMMHRDIDKQGKDIDTRAFEKFAKEFHFHDHLNGEEIQAINRKT